MPAPKDPEKRKQWQERLSKAGKGRKPWNTGKNLKDDSEYANYVDKLRNTLANAEREPMSDEQKQKISNSLKGKMKGKRIGFANGHKHSEESKRKMSESRKGKKRGPLSDEQKAKISASVKKRYEDPEYKARVHSAIIEVRKNPEVRAKLSASIKAYYQTEEGQALRQKLSELLTERQTGSTLSEEHKQAISVANKEYFNQPHIKQELSERSKAMWADPIVREKMMLALNTDEVIAARNAAVRAMWQSEEYRQQLAAKMGRVWEDEGFVEYISRVNSEHMTKRWADPEERAKMLAVNADPESRAKKSKSHKALWQDPEHREKMLPGLLERAAINNGISGTHQSPKVGDIRYRSSYELAVYKQLDENDDVTTYEAEPFSIPYEFDGTLHSYFPDILITFADNEQLLVEVKPNHKLNDPQNIAKFAAAQQQFGDRFEIWSEELIFNE